jgi:hypothetical protein
MVPLVPRSALNSRFSVIFDFISFSHFYSISSLRQKANWSRSLHAIIFALEVESKT